MTQFDLDNKIPNSVKPKVYNSCIYLLVVMYFGCLKLSLPALVFLATYFFVTDEQMKLTVAVFLLVYGCSIFIWGVLSDRFGRLFCIYSGILLIIIGSIVVFTSFSYWQYLLGRCIEGFGAGIGSPIMRSLIFDVYGKKQSSRLFANAAIIASLMPGIAPVIGGYIFYFFGWRYIFIFYCVLVVILGLYIYRNLPETSSYHQNKRVLSDNHNIKKVLGFYLLLFKNIKFWSYSICYFGFTGVMWAYYAAIPFWFIKSYGISSHVYAWLGFISILFYILSLSISKKIIHKIDNDKILLVAILFSFFAIILAVIFQLIGFINVTSIIIVMSFWSFCGGFISVPSNLGAVNSFPEKRSAASTINTGSNFICVGVFSYIEAEMNPHKLWQIALFLFIIWAITLLVFYLNIYKKKALRNGNI